jgi:hypothetical protein
MTLLQTLINLLVGAIALSLILVGPVSMIWGWLDWLMKPAMRGSLKYLSLIGFTFGSASIGLAAGSIAYSASIDGFGYYDPLLMKIFRTGFDLSVLGVFFGVAGVWRKHLLRWRAVVLPLSTLFMWFAFAMGE